MHRTPSRLASGLLLLAASALPASAAAVDDCLQAEDWSLRVAGCTAVIESGGWAGLGPATAYHNRGVALRALGDLARALSDFERAERLDPGVARSYQRLGALAALNQQLTGQPAAPLCDCDPSAPPAF
jgi:hypothetical protein